MTYTISKADSTQPSPEKCDGSSEIKWIKTCAAFAFALALPAQAALWEFSVGAFANASGVIGFQSASYVFDTDALSYAVQCPPTLNCWPGTRTTGGSIAVTYSGLVAGSTTGILQAVADNTAMDPWWQITTPGGRATGWIGDSPEWFKLPRVLAGEYPRIGPFPLLASGGDTGWNWLPVGAGTPPIQYVQGSFLLRPVPEPSMLALLLAATVAMMGWLRGRR